MDPESELFTQAIKAGAQLSHFDALDTRGKLGVFEKGNHNKAHSHWLKVYNLLLTGKKLWKTAPPTFTGRLFQSNYTKWTQEAGDLIVIPSGWMHDVTTVEVEPDSRRSVSFSVMLSSKQEVEQVIQSVVKGNESLKPPPGCVQRGKEDKIEMLMRLAKEHCPQDEARAVIDTVRREWAKHSTCDAHGDTQKRRSRRRETQGDAHAT